MEDLKNPAFMYLGKMEDLSPGQPYNESGEYIESYALLAMTNSKKGYLHVTTKDPEGVHYAEIDKIFALSEKNS